MKKRSAIFVLSLLSIICSFLVGTQFQLVDALRVSQDVTLYNFFGGGIVRVSEDKSAQYYFLQPNSNDVFAVPNVLIVGPFLRTPEYEESLFAYGVAPLDDWHANPKYDSVKNALSFTTLSGRRIYVPGYGKFLLRDRSPLELNNAGDSK